MHCSSAVQMVLSMRLSEQVPGPAPASSGAVRLQKPVSEQSAVLVHEAAQRLSEPQLPGLQSLVVPACSVEPLPSHWVWTSSSLMHWTRGSAPWSA